MPVLLVPEAADLNLVEYTVGKATNRCVYPAIQQCFAIAGMRASHMACTHVSPGSTEQDIADTFEHLKAVGGTWASDWFVIGPFAHFFTTGNAQWTSTQDIRDTFTAQFGDTGANHHIMDVSTQRDQFGFGIDVKIDFTAGNREPVCSYKKGFAAHINTWTPLAQADFDRF